MSGRYSSEPMLDMYIFETTQNIEQLEMLILDTEKSGSYTRDMSKKLDKEVQLEIIGEGTEVDKNIIEHISEPLMHLVRNAIDHGIEAAEDREASGKAKTSTVTLEAKNVGSKVMVIVKDDGNSL